MSAPLASRARAVSWNDLYLPVPTIKREPNCLPAMISESVLILLLYGDSPSIVNLQGSGGFGLRVHLVNQSPIAIFDTSPPHLEGMRQRSVGRREFFRNQQYAFQFFEARQTIVQLRDNAVIQR